MLSEPKLVLTEINLQQVAGAGRSKRKHSGDEVEVKVARYIVDALSSIKVNVRRQNTEVKTVFLGIIFFTKNLFIRLTIHYFIL